MRRLVPALGLFLLSPLVGEFLLGNLPVSALGYLVFLAPLYGGGALLIRETVRRWQLGWVSMLVLCLVYAIVEEAFVTQSLFNPNYLGLRLLDYGYISWMGISAWWTVYVLAIHTIWSTAVPIALVESFVPTVRYEPWLRPLGLAIIAILFAITCSVIFLSQQVSFLASGTQFLTSGIVIVALVIIAIMLGRRNNPVHAAPKRVLSAPLTGGIAFLLGSAFMVLAAIVHSTIPAVLNVSGMLALLTTGSILLWRGSRRSHWNAQHTFAVSGGLLLVYAWFGFVQVPSTSDTSPQLDRIGNVIFAVAAVVLLIIASKRVAMSERVAARHAAVDSRVLSSDDQRST